MYFVDRERIEAILKYLEKQIVLFHSLKDLKEPVQLIALERIVQMMVETVMDTGNAMIDGFIMRDPGSYEDIVDILLDEKVITNEMAEGFKKVIPFRKDLVQHYTELNHNEMYNTVSDELKAFEQYPACIREYLVNELGPVTAFKK